MNANPRITTANGYICLGTAQLPITEAWEIMSLWADELRADLMAGDRESASRTIEAINELALAIIAACAWLEARA